MSERESKVGSANKKADELKVVFQFAIDDSRDSHHRSQQVCEILKEMISLAHKRGRPTRKEENYEEAA